MGSIDLRLLLFVAASSVILISLFFTNYFSVVALSPTINLSNDNDPSVLPRLALAGNGEVYVVWQDNAVGNSEIKYSRSDDGENFDGPFNISNTATASSNPQIAVSDSGIFYVTWQELVPDKINDILIASSHNSFTNIVDISDNSGSSTNPRISIEGENVYLVWVDNTPGNAEIFFASSSDNFASQINVINTPSLSATPQIAVASNGTAYVVWVDSGDIFFASSSDNFASQINVSNTQAGSSSPQIAVASNGIVYTAWKDSSLGNNDIFFASSSDNFASQINVSNNEGDSSAPQLIASTDSSSNIFVTWRDNYLDMVSNTNFEILLARSSTGGNNFGCPTNISGTTRTSSNQQMAIASDVSSDVFVVWQDNTTPSEADDIFLRRSNDSFSSPIITIDSVSDTSPIWNSTIEVSGSLSGATNDDFVTVLWGDGSPSDSVLVSGCSWGPISHFYNSSAVDANPNRVVAQVRSSIDGNLRGESSPTEIMLLPRSTILSLDFIASVRANSNVTVTGSLVDAESGAGIAGKVITFHGSGADGVLNSTVTSEDGSFSSNGRTHNVIKSDLVVQARFDGDPLFSLSESETRNYITIDSSAIKYNVTAGNNVVIEISGVFSFNGSLTFPNVVEDGSFFASECTAGESFRYISPAQACLEISSLLQMGPDSTTTVSISFVNKELPTGHSSDEVDMFFYDPTQDVTFDITESRDDSKKIVIGNTTSFGKFIVSVPQYGPKPEGAVRQQVFIGNNLNNNVISFRDVGNLQNSSDTATANFDKESYELSDTALLTIRDANGNIHPNGRDTILTAIQSDSSTPEAIRLILTETEVNSGVFSGTFTFSSSTTSSDSRVLKAAAGDKLSVFYISGARFQAIVSNVSQSGVLQMTDSVADASDCFTPIGGAVDLELVDQDILAGQANMAISISYANARLLDNPASDLGMFQKVESTWVDMSELTAVSINETAKTVSAAATTARPGIFTLGIFHECIPGGGGGGLPRPGTGIVLDFDVFVTELRTTTDTTHRNARGGGSSTTAVQEPASGNDSETTARFGSESVIVRFEIVKPDSGQLKISRQELTDFREIFDEIDTVQGKHQGVVRLDGTIYSTTGNIFNIDASEVKFEGAAEVTIPYDQETVGGKAANVRFLYYDEEKEHWEDKTVGINSSENTVTGMLDTFSPVVAALVNDGTFGEGYFGRNPLSKIATDGSIIVSQAHVREQLSIPVMLKNVQRADQAYTLLTQIVDREGVARSISWQTGTLGRGQDTEISTSWIAEEEGTYKIQIFVWDSLNNPSPLSGITIREIKII